MAQPEEETFFGVSQPRSEDRRLLTGSGSYVEDLRVEGAAYAVFVRSVAAHARIRDIQADEARKMPGVLGVFTGDDLGLDLLWGSGPAEGMGRPPLATDVVRFVGEAVAVVVAGTRAQAEDAAEAVLVDYDFLPAVVGLERALEPDAPVLFPDRGTNLVVEERKGDRAATLAGAPVVVRGRFVNQRVAPLPLETNAALAVPEDGGMTLWLSHQAPFFVRSAAAVAAGLDAEHLRVRTPDAVGGAFGAKIFPYPEHVTVAALASRLSRPVRYAETRSESLMTMTHGRGQIQEVEIGATSDGTITGLHLRVVGDCGAYPGIGWDNHELTIMMSTGPYRVPQWSSELVCVVTNTTPMSAYRGAGRPEATALLEQAIDLLSAEMGLDPVEVRRRNLLRPDEFPYATPTGALYDSGDYQRALDDVLERAGYVDLRAEQAGHREAGDRFRLGIGVCTYAEITGAMGAPSSDFGAVEVHGDGTATVRTGISPHGQGHETSFAQLVNGVLGIPFESIQVLHSDSAVLPSANGTYGSRSLQIGGSAVYRAAGEVRDKGRRLAAHLLEASADDIVLTERGMGVAGVPERSFQWGELAALAADPSRLPQGMEPGLAAELNFTQEHGTFPFGAHIAVVQVDSETGDARLTRYIAVDDSGRLLNPMMAQGQIHGGIAQGIGQALFEEIAYDDGGNPLSANLGAYLAPYASELPSFDTVRNQTPTPVNPLGVKGIGESGAIAAPPAVVNAVVDALADLGIRHVDMPLTPERVWRAIREHSGG